MYIKLKIEGELLKALETDAEEYVRTCTQQAMYIIKSHYKNKNNKNLIIQESSSNTNIDNNMEKECSEVSDTDTDEPEINIGNEEFIDEEIYNF